MSETVVGIVSRYWELMATNDFKSVGSILSDDYVLEWPQSKERIRGRDKFAAMNEEYPAQDHWKFTINRIIGNGSEAVSDVFVSDGVQFARVISFFTVSGEKIVKMVEFWPDNYPGSENHKHLVEPLE